MKKLESQKNSNLDILPEKSSLILPEIKKVVNKAFLILGLFSAVSLTSPNGLEAKTYHSIYNNRINNEVMYSRNQSSNLEIINIGGKIIGIKIGDRQKIRDFIVKNRENKNSYSQIINKLKIVEYPYYYYEENKGFKKYEKVKTLEDISLQNLNGLDKYSQGQERKIFIFDFGNRKENFDFFVKGNYLFITWLKKGETKIINLNQRHNRKRYNRKNNRENEQKFVIFGDKKNQGEEIGFPISIF